MKHSLFHPNILKTLIFLFLVGIFTGCSSKTPENKKEISEEETVKPLPVIDLAAVIEKEVPDTFTWNSIAKKTTIIPLETSGRHTLLGVSPHVIFIGENEIFVAEYQTSTLYKYDKKGRLKHAFRHVGNGPGEYTYLSSIFITAEDSTIQVFDNGNKKRIFYDWNGKLIRESFLKNTNINMALLITNNKLISRGNPESAAQFYISDLNLENQQPVCSFDTTLAIWEKAAIHLTSARNMNNDRYLFNRMVEDSVFCLTDQGKEPCFILKKGKYKLPPEEIKNFMKLPKGHSYLQGLALGILPNHYIIMHSWHDKSWAEIWSRKTNQVISRSEMKAPNQYEIARGIPFALPSGNKVKLCPDYISGHIITFMMPAEEVAGEIEGVKEDDNPVLLILEI